MTPVEGLEVRYKDRIGYIRFVSDSYVTVCIQEHQDKSRDVCIVVYKEDFSKLQLLKESEK